MSYRITPAAQFDVDQIWSYIIHQSGSSEIADHLVDAIYERIVLLANYPYLGRDRAADLGYGSRSFAVDEYVIVYRVDAEKGVRILRVVHGRRDFEAIFGR